MEIHAAVVTTFGSPPTYQPFTLPPPGPSQHRIRVLATALHTLVRARAAGKHYSSPPLPQIPGVDGVGLIESSSATTTSSLLPGQLVYFNALANPTGSFATHINVAAADTFPLPASTSPATLAAVVNGGMSSWMALTSRAGISASDQGISKPFSACVLGATGTSGRIAVQMCKALGASTVVAVGRNAGALEATRELGADVLVRLPGVGEKEKEKEKLEEVGWEAAAEMDVVLDYLWGETSAVAMRRVLGARRDKTRRLVWVGVGSITGAVAGVDQSLLRKSNTMICGCGPGSYSMDELRQQLPRLLEVLVQKGVRSEVEVRKLTDVEKVWAETGTKRLVFEP
ncbi:GroES-like protein [Viridothelium virens]|uniref:GroES-like protein n=1 Tax=Viridothelium virens TaxID=1048519 RepID=A0A6A6H0X3_VIRVR|nr:GroES-like protein [Viridothelium virens]